MCHIRHLNPLKIHPERITKAYKRMINDLNYVDIKFLSKKGYSKIEQKNSICINVFRYEMIWFIPHLDYIIYYQAYNASIHRKL